jgi:transposase
LLIKNKHIISPPLDLRYTTYIEACWEANGVEKWMAYSKIHELKQKGFTIAAIARKVGLSRNTVYQHLNKSPEEFSEWLLTLANRAKKLDQYQDRILQWLQEHPDLTGAQVHDWLKEHYEGFAGGESTVRNYVADLRENIRFQKLYRLESIKWLKKCRWENRSKWILGKSQCRKLMLADKSSGL